MQFDTIAELLHTLKGNRLHVLVALFAQSVLPVSETLVAETAGVHVQTTRGHLKALKRLGIVERVGRYESWTLTAQARQLPLPLHVLADNNQPSGHFLGQQMLVDNVPVYETGSAKSSLSSANFSPSSAKSSRSSRDLKDDLKKDVVVVNLNNFKDQQQHLKSTGSAKSSLSTDILSWLGVVGAGRFVQVEDSAVLGMSLYALVEMNNPAGYVFSRLNKNITSSSPDFEDLSSLWLDLNDEKRTELLDSMNDARLRPNKDILLGDDFGYFVPFRPLKLLMKRWRNEVTANGFIFPDCLLPEVWREV